MWPTIHSLLVLHDEILRFQNTKQSDFEFGLFRTRDKNIYSKRLHRALRFQLKGAAERQTFF